LFEHHEFPFLHGFQAYFTAWLIIYRSFLPKLQAEL